jgi:actin related protein 2/3 complex, subunit 1A/1B
MFRQMDLHGQTRSNTQLDTVHQNAISTLRVYEEHGGVVKKFTSKFSVFYWHSYNVASVDVLAASGVDGRVVVWTI